MNVPVENKKKLYSIHFMNEQNLNSFGDNFLIGGILFELLSKNILE